MMRKPVKPPEGARMKETADMLAWRKEFEEMKTEDHLAKMKELGLDDEDMEEFKEMRAGKSIEKELLGESGDGEEIPPTVKALSRPAATGKPTPKKATKPTISKGKK